MIRGVGVSRFDKLESYAGIIKGTYQRDTTDEAEFEARYCERQRLAALTRRLDREY